LILRSLACLRPGLLALGLARLGCLLPILDCVSLDAFVSSRSSCHPGLSSSTPVFSHVGISTSSRISA
jgi:hypothetical protein